MSIIFNDGNKDHHIEIIDYGFEEIEVEPADYVNNKYILDDRKLKIDGNEVHRIPVDSLSNSFKGKIGENASCIRRNLSRDDAEDFYYLTEHGFTYDITNCLGTSNVEVKTGFEKHYDKTGSATAFNFFLATNHPGQNGVKISATKSKKNYEADGITEVEFIGIFTDSVKLPDTYIIPTSNHEIKNYSTIKIPSSGKTKYAKYKKDTSASYKLDE